MPESTTQDEPESFEELLLKAAKDPTLFEELMFGRKAATVPETIAWRIADDLDGRSGYDLGGIDEETMRELAQDWVAIIEGEIGKRLDRFIQDLMELSE